MGPKSKHETHLFYIYSKILLHSTCGLHSFEVRSKVFHVHIASCWPSKRSWDIWIFRSRMLSLYCVMCVRVQGSVHAIAVVMCSVCCLVCRSAAAEEPGARWPPQSSCQTHLFLMVSVWSFWGKGHPESCNSNIPKAPAVRHIFTLHIVIATFLIL